MYPRSIVLGAAFAATLFAGAIGVAAPGEIGLGEIAIAAPELALPHGDQFDRIITATAKIHRLPLITRDANIGASSEISTIW